MDASEEAPSIDRLALIDAACDRFEAAWRHGQRPDAEVYLAQLPEDLRDEARAELAAIAREMTSREAATLTAAMHLRCPHCEGGVELLADASLENITCGTCGSVFGLVGGDQPDTVAPQRVGRFVLREQLGMGGFGAVWRAYDPDLDREVAIKVPRRGALSRAEAELFFREARAAAQLSHPNIVPVHEVGRDGEAIYIVSELVHGESLAERLKAGRPAPRQAARLLATIADALHAAHERGVVHRDLKPGNVMLAHGPQESGTVWGEPRLMDFGLAKRATGEITMTVQGQVLGTPAYMSPEQAGGETQWTDRRTDIYSLGVMLFEMLTGELPFRGPASSQIEQRLKDDAPSVRRLAPHAPVDLATICAKCLERNPAARYATAEAVAEELRRWREHRPIAARPITRWGRAARWARRRPALATALLLGATLAVAGPLVAIVFAQQRAALAERLVERDRLVQQAGNDLDLLRGELDRLKRGEAPVKPRALAGLLPTGRRSIVEQLLEQRAAEVDALFQASAPANAAAQRDRLAAALLAIAVGDERGRRVLSEVESSLDELARSVGADAPALSAHALAAMWLARLRSAERDTVAAAAATQRRLRSARRILDQASDPLAAELGLLSATVEAVADTPQATDPPTLAAAQLAPKIVQRLAQPGASWASVGAALLDEPALLSVPRQQPSETKNGADQSRPN
ncbi:serine/threonine-protein kinase [Botrimarina hoheduenensis]|uniref:Serine/threonine-protein kinase PrkC n=1 Tax=Botrimarina hoheduenensis TaxID=2528000 RepID=A0A5C5VXI6_9BACT|nr:serine/threonine-protein kinase [Botrimarina hoheduenensis]TWT43154.1 Serine/threonine-protein kinase PrkC [Botrimarina hoheduenensis]